jgi:16S rRNA C967 or C1407 C5-methylase (RsmB/RsmF family)/NOL1/NOP2/fmu family ribosome biogenesis protein
MFPLPLNFCSRIEKDERFGSKLLEDLEANSPISIRKNPSKVSTQFAGERPVAWCKNGVYLPERPSFTLDPNFHAGSYYPQEAGSMYLDAILRSLELPENPSILDLCAAPGGKSTLIASHLNGKGVLVSNEVIRTRSHILAENCSKWGFSNVLVSNNDPADFEEMPSLFDVIVVDAPCSGEGMFRKDQRSRNEWSEENAALCSSRQRRILMDIWTSLKEDGFLIYSTCTFNSAENEDNIDWFLSQVNAELMPLPVYENVLYLEKNRGAYFVPGQTESEGFYCVILQKKESQLQKTSKLKPQKSVDVSFLKDWCEWNENLTFSEYEGNLRALTIEANELYLNIGQKLRWVKRGVAVATNQKKNWQPEAEWALSVDSKFHETVILNRHDAISYLQGNVLNLNAGLGWKVVQFEGNNLGWVKNIGNRMNNAYPKEWRIRMKIDLKDI